MALRSEVPASLNRVVGRCLEKVPEHRFQTARDLVFALENPPPRIEQGQPSRPRRVFALAIDPVFSALRQESRFTKLLAQIASDVAAMRARANYEGLP